MRYFWAVLLGVIVILSSLHASYSQTYDSSLVGSSVIVTKIGASLTKSSIESGDLESALVYSKFTTDYYSQQIGALRPTENPAVDQLHLLLIDIHSKIENGSLDSVSADLDYVLSEIEKFPKSLVKLHFNFEFNQKFDNYINILSLINKDKNRFIEKIDFKEIFFLLTTTLIDPRGVTLT
mgnify:CR=1 FL=1